MIRNLKTVRDFVQAELDDGALLEDLLEDFGICPVDTFIMLVESGMIDPDELEAYVLDIN